MRILQLSLMVFCLYQKAFHYTYSMMVKYNLFLFHVNTQDLLIHMQ